MSLDVDVDGVFDVHTDFPTHNVKLEKLPCFALRTASSIVLSTETLIPPPTDLRAKILH
jgi:hypothetical protein